MRDDTQRWDAPFDMHAPLSAKGVTLQRINVARQTLVSGPGVLPDIGVIVVEWPRPAPSGAYALSLRRDRVLVVDGPERQDGWDGEYGWAVSDISDGYAVFDLIGPSAFDILRKGAEITLDQPSPSVSRILFGLGVFLYRVETEDRFRVHVSTPHAQALYQHLCSALADD